MSFFNFRNKIYGPVLERSKSRLRLEGKLEDVNKALLQKKSELKAQTNNDVEKIKELKIEIAYLENQVNRLNERIVKLYEGVYY